MNPQARLAYCASVALCASCGVDERTLSYDYQPPDVTETSGAAGRGTSSGSANGAASNAGVAGKTAQSSGGACSGCGGNGNAGTSAELGGAAGSSNASGGASTAVNAGRAGSAPGGSTAAGGASAGSAGQAGTTVNFPCGDLNQDLVDDCQQTLVLNSRFDSAVDDWDLEPSTARVWNANDASGKAGSGSLQVSNLLPAEQAVGVVLAGSRQCIPVSPTTNYDFAANVMLPSGQAGQAGLNVWLFDDGACAGNLVTGAVPFTGGEADKWTTLKGKVWIPGAVHSMYVRLVAIKPFSQTSLSVLVDDVLVAKRP